MIELRQLSAGYGQRTVLQALDLTLKPGELTVIGGVNGCGKSTLLRTVAGLLSPKGGQVLLDGIPLESLSPRQRAFSLAYLPQGRNMPGLTALRMVLHGRFAYLSFPRRYRREDLDAARRALEWVGCGDLADRSMDTLSGGQRQKIYLAMALAQDAGAVLLDEPTTYLDIRGRFEVMELAQRLTETGKTVVMVLHDLDLMLRCADRVVLLKDGAIAADGPPERLAENGAIDRVFGVRTEKAHTSQGSAYVFLPVDSSKKNVKERDY